MAVEFSDEWIWSRVAPEPNTGCWLWTGPANGRTPSNYYGVLMLSGKRQLAHRAFYEHFRGQIPAGLCVLHSCDVTACCNPDHLFVGTHSENMADKVRKNRHAKGSVVAHYGDQHWTRSRPELVRRGETHPCSKVGLGEVEQIRAASANGESIKSLARRFGLSRGAVYAIATGRTWRHV